MRILHPATCALFQIQGARERLKDLTRGLDRINGPTIASQDSGLACPASLALLNASSTGQ